MLPWKFCAALETIECHLTRWTDIETHADVVHTQHVILAIDNLHHDLIGRTCAKHAVVSLFVQRAAHLLAYRFEESHMRCIDRLGMEAAESGEPDDHRREHLGRTRDKKIASPPQSCGGYPCVAERFWLSPV